MSPSRDLTPTRSIAHQAGTSSTSKLAWDESLASARRGLTERPTEPAAGRPEVNAPADSRRRRRRRRTDRMIAARRHLIQRAGRARGIAVPTGAGAGAGAGARDGAGARVEAGAGRELELKLEQQLEPRR